MGRIKRKVRENVKNSKKPFNEWYDEHKEEIGRVVEDEPEFEESIGSVRIKKRIPNIIWTATAGVVFLLIVIVSSVMLFNRESTQPQIPDLTFGEESVETVDLEEGAVSELMIQVPQLMKLENISGTQSIYQVDDSVVMTLISGEMETVNDFYFVEVRIVYNDNFVFLDKWEYEELESETVIGDTTIMHESKGQDDFGLNVFFAVTETESGFLYWKVSCLEGLFEEWLEEMFV